jgi:hypothetical protein
LNGKKQKVPGKYEEKNEKIMPGLAVINPAVGFHHHFPDRLLAASAPIHRQVFIRNLAVSND